MDICLVPIDRLAGHDDTAVDGGNSTSSFDAATAVLSTQQAIDLKKAVQLAIGQAMALIASTQVDAGAFGQDSVSRPVYLNCDEADCGHRVSLTPQTPRQRRHLQTEKLLPSMQAMPALGLFRLKRLIRSSAAVSSLPACGTL